MAAGFYRYVLHGDRGSHWGHTPFLAPQELAGLPQLGSSDLALMFLFVPLGELFIDRNNFFTAGPSWLCLIGLDTVILSGPEFGRKPAVEGQLNPAASRSPPFK